MRFLALRAVLRSSGTLFISEPGHQMPSLTHFQYQQLLDFIAELQEPVGNNEFGKRLVSLVGELVPNSVVAFDQIHEASGKYHLIDHNCPMDAADTERYFARLQAVYQQNPIYPYIQGGGKGPIVKLSELCSRERFHRTDFYNDVFHPLGLEHQMTVLMPREGWITTLTINRDKDFAQPVADLFLLASRHIILAHRNAQLLGDLSSPAREPETALTRREQDVFQWMREGKRNGEIALILGCSVRTIEKHVEHILRKTSAETRGAAVRNRDVG